MTGESLMGCGLQSINAKWKRLDNDWFHRISNHGMIGIYVMSNSSFCCPVLFFNVWSTETEVK
jgi:hypothetical protein